MSQSFVSIVQGNDPENPVHEGPAPPGGVEALIRLLRQGDRVRFECEIKRETGKKQEVNEQC